MDRFNAVFVAILLVVVFRFLLPFLNVLDTLSHLIDLLNQVHVGSHDL